MIVRLLIVVAVTAGCGLFWLVARAYLGWRRSKATYAIDEETNEATANNATPTLLYLYSKSCGQCPPQARAVEALESRLPGRFRVEKIDALADPDLATRFDVWTVPATVVFDSAGRVRAVNCGLTSVEQLERQVLAAAGARAA